MLWCEENPEGSKRKNQLLCMSLHFELCCGGVDTLRNGSSVNVNLFDRISVFLSGLLALFNLIVYHYLVLFSLPLLVNAERLMYENPDAMVVAPVR